MIHKLCRAFLLTGCSLTAADVARFYRVDDHVYRGGQPLDTEYAALAKMGIRTVLDLRGGAVHTPRERKQVEAAGMRYVAIGLSGLFAPSYQQMTQILAVLQDSDQGPVFVHCRRGADRSGVVIACYRVVHDHWTNVQALKEAREHGISGLEVLMRQYILHFDPLKIQPPAGN